ncbi:MAG: hypothetical protein DME18_12640 [Verrucomicrobia bacterium]|nr:MAG: hypothetical protein DME18_12640 [Verrucomicrobiota bacterium]
MSSRGAMIETLKCSSCGHEIRQDVSFHQCPRCLLDLGLSYQRDGANGALDDPGFESDAKFGLRDYELLERIGLSIAPANCPCTGSWP